jgi:hypothetical protein
VAGVPPQRKEITKGPPELVQHFRLKGYDMIRLRFD